MQGSATFGGGGKSRTRFGQASGCAGGITVAQLFEGGFALLAGAIAIVINRLHEDRIGGGHIIGAIGESIGRRA